MVQDLKTTTTNKYNAVSFYIFFFQQTTRNKVIVMQLTEHGSLFNMLEDPKNAYGLPEEEFLIVFEHVSKYKPYPANTESD